MGQAQADLKRLSEEEALALFEGLRWPDGVVTCSHCGSQDVVSLVGKQYRAGLRHCRSCRKQFSATTGTALERSRVKMWQWVYVFAAMAASKKGISSHQLRRELGVQYKTALFMTHRARYVMKHGPSEPKLSGTLEMDETYVGGKPRNPGELRPKMPVVVLLERGGGARAVVTCDVTAKNVLEHVRNNADMRSELMTDESSLYAKMHQHMGGGHKTTKHSARQYAKGRVHSNSAESWASLLKRAVYGNWHHVSPERLALYVAEMDHKWNTRQMSDTARALDAMRRVVGKRLYYRKPKGLIEAGTGVLGRRSEGAAQAL